MTSTRRPSRTDRSRPPKNDAPRVTSRRAGTGKRRARPDSIGPNRTGEWLVVLPVALLSMLGMVMVYSASSVASVNVGAASWSVLARQIGYLVLGVLVAIIVARIPLRIWRDHLAALVLAVAIFLLIVIMIPGNPLAVSVNGATRWLELGPIQFQPSELAKPALVLWLARLLDVRRNQIGNPRLLIPVLVGFGCLAGLVLLGDDMGTTLLLGLMMLAMLYMAGMPTRTVGSLAGGMAALGALSIVMLGGFRRRRILAFLNPDQYALSEAWQLHQSQIGLASGGLFGSGPGYSRAKWGYLGPEAHTDFILAVIGEELGLVGTMLVILCFVAIMVGGAKIAAQAKDQFGRLVAVGVTAWLGIQAIVNISVNVGTMPTKGITLPFVSYGGTSLLVSFAGIGLLLAVARDK